MVFDFNILTHGGVGFKEAHHFFCEYSFFIRVAKGLCSQFIKELLLQMSVVFTGDKYVFLAFRNSCFFYCCKGFAVYLGTEQETAGTYCLVDFPAVFFGKPSGIDSAME